MSNHSSPLSDVSPPSTTLGDTVEERNTAALELELEEEVMIAREDADEVEVLPVIQDDLQNVEVLAEAIEVEVMREDDDVLKVGRGPTSNEAIVPSTSPPAQDQAALAASHVDPGMEGMDTATSPEVYVPTLKRTLPEEFDTILLSPSPPPTSTNISTSPINLIPDPPSPSISLSIIFTQPTISTSVPSLPLPLASPLSVPPIITQAASILINPQHNPYEDINSVASKAAKSASEWNGLLKYARKSRGPQWDWGSGIYQVDIGSEMYYAGVPRKGSPPPESHPELRTGIPAGATAMPFNTGSGSSSMSSSNMGAAMGGGVYDSGRPKRRAAMGK